MTFTHTQPKIPDMADCESCLLTRYVKPNGESFCVKNPAVIEILPGISGLTEEGENKKGSIPQTVINCDHPSEYEPKG